MTKLYLPNHQKVMLQNFLLIQNNYINLISIFPLSKLFLKNNNLYLTAMTIFYKSNNHSFSKLLETTNFKILLEE